VEFVALAVGGAELRIPGTFEKSREDDAGFLSSRLFELKTYAS
jgi:hypothetical protein